MIFLGIVLVIILVLIFMAVSYKNKFVILDTRVKNAWSQIDVQLQNRFNLIPNLVETVKGYAKHEKETFEGLTKARANFAEAKTSEEKMMANSQLNSFLGRLIAVSEAYPELKANVNFLELQKKLNELEDKIRFSRQFYNDTVTKYNQEIQMVPGCFFANFFRYEKAELFKAENEAMSVPKVHFD